MKKTFPLIGLILAASFYACEDKIEFQNHAQGIAWGGTLFSVSISAAENITDKLEFTVWKANTESGRTIAPQNNDGSWMLSDKEDMILNIKPQRAEWEFGVEESIFEEYFQWVSTKGEEITNELERICHEDSMEVAYQNYTYAGILDGAKITSDKTLFGREPGTDLSDMFYANPGYGTDLTIIASYPAFHIVHNGYTSHFSLTFKDVYSPGNAMMSPSSNMLLTLSEVPSEQLEEVTFFIEIPIECEYLQQMFYGRDYPSDFYEQNFIVPNENRVLKGSVTIKFQ